MSPKWRLFRTSILLLFLYSTTLNAQVDPPSTGTDGCFTAPLICNVNQLDEYEGQTMATPPSNPCPFSQAPDCPNSSCENNQWFSFVANVTDMQIEIAPTVCEGGTNGNALQGVIWEVTDCSALSGFSPVSNCFSNAAMQDFTLNATGLIPGNIYYIMLDGFSGALCTYDVNVLNAGPPTVDPDLTGPISGPTDVCPGATGLVYCIDVGVGIQDYDWSWLGGSIGTITDLGLNADASQYCIEIDYTAAGASVLQVVGSNECAEAPPVTLGPITSLPIVNPIQNDFICIGQSISWECYNFIGNGGSYTCDYTSWLGCDSSVTLIVGIYPVTPPNFDLITLCEDQCPYNFNGADYCASGTYFYDYQDANGCDVQDQLFLTILFAEANILDPNPIGCGADTIITLDGSLSTSVPENGGLLTYLWTGPGIITDPTLISVDVDAPGEYTLTVSQSFAGITCEDMASVTVIEDNAFPNTPNANGDNEICGVGQTGTYSVIPSSTGASQDGFAWSVLGGQFIANASGDTIVVTWDSLGIGEVCVGAYNDCDTSFLDCLNIVIGEAPVLDALLGAQTVCSSDTSVVYTLSPTSDLFTYTWNVSGGASFNNLGDTIQVDFTGADSVQICVVAENSCGPSNQLCQDITINAEPIIDDIVGNDIYCVDDSGSFSITAGSDVDSISWLVPANGSITAGQGTSNVDILWNSSGTNQLCVEFYNECGTNQSCLDITVNENPTADISGDLLQCVESADSLNLDLVLSGQSPWTVVVSHDGVNEFTITYNNSPAVIPVLDPGTYTIVQVTDGNGCNSVGTGSGTLSNYAIPTATLSGNGSICEGSGACVQLDVLFTGQAPFTIQYAIDNVAQAPLTGIVDINYLLEICTPGEVTLLTQTDDNGCAGTAGGIVIVEENTIPIVSNIDNSCDPSDDTEYFVSFEINAGDASTYTVLPAGSGTLTGNIFTSNPVLSGTPYNFEVFDGNGCDTIDVSGIFVCNCGNDVGEMNQDVLNICNPDCATAIYDNSSEVLSANDILQFVLHEGSGLSLQNPLVFSTNPEFCFDASIGMVLGQTYYISAITGDDDGTGNVDLNDLCLAVAQGSPVRYYELPAVTLGVGGEICVGDQYGINVDFTAGAAPYSIVVTDGLNIDTLSGIQSTNYVYNVNPVSTTNYCFTSVFNANCEVAINTCVDVVVNDAPTVADVSTSCNNTGDQFQVSFDINDGDSNSYEVLPAGSGTLTGNQFLSNFIPENSTYSFQVIDINLCDTILVETSVPVECECLSMVGSITDISYEICGGDLINVSYDPTGEFQDGNDALNYILYLGNLNDLASIVVLEQNTTGVFAYDNLTMTFGEIYNVAAIVGNASGGLVELNDACLAVSTVVPAVFYEIPTASIVGSDTICIGEETNVTILFTGDPPYSIDIIEDAGGSTNTINVTDVVSNTYTYTSTPSENTTYSISNLTDENCIGTVSGTMEVIVNEAPVVNNVVETINANNTDVTVTFEIVGGNAPYNIVDGDGNVIISNDGTFTSSEIPCGNGYYFEVDDGNACGPIIVNVASTDCPCLTNAGSITEVGPIAVCNDIVSLTYDNSLEVLDGNDTISFIIHDGSYVPLVPNSTSPDFVFGGSMTYGTTYVVSVVAGDESLNGGVNPNGVCLDTNSVAQVVFYEEPNAILSGDAVICEGDATDLSVEFTSGFGPWTVELQNNQTGDITSHTLNNASDVINISPAVTTNYTLISVTDNIGLCNGGVSGSALVQVQNSPTASNIQGVTDYVAETFNISFTINGGDSPTYLVSLDAGALSSTGTINLSNFTADPIPCTDQGSIYTFYLLDGFGCTVEEIEVEVDCECFTSIGTFNTASADYCSDENISTSSVSNSNLDGNDVINYVVVTSPADWQNTILDVSLTPDFVNDPALYECETTYYIIAIIGDDLGNGFVDPTDQCLVVSSPKPFQVLCPVSGDFFSDEYQVCIGNPVSISFDFEGVGPFTIVINDGVTNQTLQNLTEGEIVQLNLTDTTTLTLLSVADNGTGCSAVVNEAAVVNVNGVPNAGTVNASPALCFNELQLFDLNNLLDGEDADGIWSEISTVPSSGIAFDPALGTFSTSNQNPGIYLFEYFLEGEGSCPDDLEVVSVEIYELPIAAAGLDTEITCEDETTEIGTQDSSTGPDITYSWTDASGNEVSSESVFTTAVGGNFLLTVENTVTGCVDVDDILVDDKIVVLALDITDEDVTCYDFNDGLIVVNNVIGGEGPYVYSFDGGLTFSGDNNISELPASIYDVVVMDLYGCTNEMLQIEIVEPDLLTLDIQADFPTEINAINYGDTLLLELQSNAPITQISWTPSELVSCDTCSIVAVAPTNTTLFNVDIQAGVCSTSESLALFVLKDRPVFVPSAFSPNGDNVNDILAISVGSFVKEIKSFAIYTRWGEQLISKSNFMPTNQPLDPNGWDGTLNGNLCDSGVYVYMLEVEFEDGTTEQYKGDITLLK
ncbi:MAG: gliding motility-associated C-terminal domain-containing protein [Saprospiraceae bacterium]|nr:gliding motility-associated C-terminal domain-containing protein [Saprospiraceae bacterium]